MRFRQLLLLPGALLVIAAWSYPLWRPLLVDDLVAEAFPGLRAELQDHFRLLDAAEQDAWLRMHGEDAEMALAMVEAALATPVLVIEERQDTARRLAGGRFTRSDALHWAQGSAVLYQAENSRFLRLENFYASNGPDLRVLLSAHAAPRSPADLQAAGGAFEVGRLKGNVGDQNYNLPANFDAGRYNSVVIYCRRFNVIFSIATLQP